MPEPDDLLDDLFLGCALSAYLEQAQIQQGWPDSEATRRRAYRLYEDAVAIHKTRELPGRPRRPLLDITQGPDLYAG
jgi:hypothetical protein